MVPALVLAEVDYFLGQNRAAMRGLVDDILDPVTTYRLEPTNAEDLRRAMALDAKFRPLEIGLVDGLVAAVAERLNIRRVLTIDVRDFGAIRVGVRHDRVLEIVPTPGRS